MKIFQKDQIARITSAILALLMVLSFAFAGTPVKEAFAGESEDNSDGVVETNPDYEDHESEGEDLPDEEEDMGITNGTLSYQVGSGGLLMVNGVSSASALTSFAAGTPIEFKIIPDVGYEIDMFRISSDEQEYLSLQDFDEGIHTEPYTVRGGIVQTVEVSFMVEEEDPYKDMDETEIDPQVKAKTYVTFKTVDMKDLTNISKGRGYRTSDGQLAYCANMRKHGAGKGLKGKLVTNSSKQKQWDYLMYYGYPRHTKINGTSFSKKQAHDITQWAAWIITEPGLRGKLGQLNNSASAVKKAVYALVDGAKNYDGKDDKINGSALLYAPANSSKQPYVMANGQKPPVEGAAKLVKVSSCKTITEDNAMYSLAGAQYGLYSDSGCTTKVGNFVTDGNGDTAAVTLLPATYYVKEETASKGYEVDPSVYSVVVKSKQTATFTAVEKPQNDPLGIELAKIDREVNKEGIPLGTATLAGAQFTVNYYDTHDSIAGKPPKRTWVFETQENNGRFYALYDRDYKVSGKDVYVMDGKPVLPLGTFEIWESKAPKGYLLNEEAYLRDTTGKTLVTGGTHYVAKVTNEGGSVHLIGGNKYSRIDRVKRGDFKLQKTANGGDRLANVKFSVTSVKTGECHEFTTDGNGMYDSSSSFNPHSQNTNGGGAGDGIWFGQYQDSDGTVKMVDVRDNYGALVFDEDYILNELRCEANEGLNLITGVHFNISRDGYEVNLGSFDDGDVWIGTTAVNDETGTHYASAQGDVTVVDTVAYHGLEKGKEYTLEAIPMQKETEEPLTDKDGEEITVLHTFTAEREEGSEDVEVTFPADDLGGSDIVMFESLYSGDDVSEEPEAEHKDISDGGQTVHFPEIGTSLKDQKTESNVTKAEEEITLVDTVSYSNLEKGKTYTVKGTLMNQETGKPVTDAEGKTVTSETTFKAEDTEGTVEVTFTFDGRHLAGETLVAFEELSYRQNVIAVHADLEDEAQATIIPKVETEAEDEETGSHNAFADETVTVVDTVEYSNVLPGKEYRVSGILMDKKTGQPLKDSNGEEITAEITFTAEDTEGSVELTFTFDASALAGETVVAFEHLYMDGKEVAVHTDINDDDQSVFFPKVGTKASDKADGDQTVKAGKEITITDMVSYENVLPGKEYKIAGVLMDQKTGKPLKIGGKTVSSEKTFTPVQTSGTETLEFTFSTTGMEGDKLVAFEKLYYVDSELGDQEVANHEDLKDENQTVQVEKDKPGTTGKTPENPSTSALKRVQTGVYSHGGLFALIALSCCTGGALMGRRRIRRSVIKKAGIWKRLWKKK